MAKEYRFGDDSPEYKEYLDIEAKFLNLELRAEKLPEELRIRLLMGWYLETEEWLKEMGVDLEPEREEKEDSHEGNGLEGNGLE